MTKKKTTQADTTPRLPVDEIESVTGRLVLVHPVTFEPMPNAWIDLAHGNSEQGDKANAAMVVKQRASNVSPTKMSDEEFLKFTFKQDRELAARLIVDWNKDYFGELSVERAIELLEQKRWVYVQVEHFLKNNRNFYKA